MAAVELVGGFVCHNCTEVSLAQKGIDPAHPEDGPYGRDKKVDDANAESARSLGPVPLATSGTVGTRLNAFA